MKKETAHLICCRYTMNYYVMAIMLLLLFFSIHVVTAQMSVDQETWPSNQPFTKCFGNDASRVCRPHENEDPFVFKCDENYLKRKPVFLTSSPWRSSMYMTWIAQIIISEILHYPVYISHNGGGDHEFYSKEIASILNTVEYSWRGFETASVDVECNEEVRRSRGISPELAGTPECVAVDGIVPLGCYPCTHAMLDVWSETQTAEIEKYVYKDRVAEISSPTGYEGGVGLYMPKTALEKIKGISSFTALRDPDVAGQFGRLLTLGQYCMKVFLGLIPHDPPDILNDNGRRRRCSEADVAANNACNVGSYVSGAPSDDSFCELFYLFGGPAADAAGVPMTRETCRDAKPGEPADDIHILCSKFTITTQDIFRYLSPLAAEIGSSRFATTNPLYTGYFDTEFEDPNHPVDKLATVAVKGCNWKSPVNPLGARWSHDYLEMAKQDGMRLRAVDYGEYLLEVHDAASRKAIDDSVFQPQLIMLERPNAQFKRYKYQSNVRKPFTFNKREPELVAGGEAFQLVEMSMAPNTEECQARRLKYFQGHCPEDNEALKNEGLSSTPMQNSYTCGNFSDNQVNPICAPQYDHCGFRKYKPVKVFSSKLEEYNPEVHYFLRNFELSLDDIEEILGRAGYDTTYTAASNTDISQRHVVCDWVKSNMNKWNSWLPSSVSSSSKNGTDARRCLGEIAPSYAGGKYTAGIMCSGHGSCEAEPSRGVSNSYAGVCKCDPGYIGDDCGTLGEGLDINIKLDDPLVLTMFSINGLCFIFITMVWIFIYPNRNEPVIFYCSYNFLKYLTYSAQIGYAHLYFWVGNPSVITCMVRPLLAIFPFLIFVGTIFARIYRTSLILWGKTPPPKIVTDGGYVYSILKKVLIPEVVICTIWMLVATPTVEIGRPEGRLYEQYAYCNYGTIGNTLSGIAIAYIVLVAAWAFVLLVVIYRSDDDPLYHNDTFLMTKSLAVVLVICGIGLAGGLILEQFPNLFSVRFVLICITTAASSLFGLYVIIFPKYKSIYLKPDENIIFPGKLYQQQVMENNKLRKIFPTEDETSIDPRVLRKNKELLKENLQLIESMHNSAKELKEADVLLKEYEDARQKREDMINATADENANVLDDVPSRDGDGSEDEEDEEGEEHKEEENSDGDSDDESGFKIPSYNIVPRLKAVVEAAVTEASEHLSRMDEAKMSEAAKSKSLEEKRRKVNLAIDQIELQRKKRKKLEVASHNALPPLDNILRYHNLLQYTRLFRKLKMTTAKLIQLQPAEIKRLGMRLGHQRKLEVAIKNLVGTAPPPLPTPTATPAPSEVSELFEDINEMSAAAILSRFELDELSEKFIEFGCEGSADLLLISEEDLDQLGLDEEQFDIFQDLKDWMEEQYRKIEIERERRLQEVPEVDEEDSVSDTSMKDDDENGDPLQLEDGNPPENVAVTNEGGEDVKPSDNNAGEIDQEEAVVTEGGDDGGGENEGNKVEVKVEK